MKTQIAVFAALVLMLFCGGCATNAVTGKTEFQLMGGNISSDVAMGQQASEGVIKEMSKGEVSGPMQNYVNYVGQKIAAVSHNPELEWHFMVLNNETVNAFALPGGYIYITTGMLKALQNESQMAAVLAHEAVHVTARHSASAMSKQLAVDLAISLGTNAKTASAMRVAQIVSQLEGLSYSRKHEREADFYGLDYLVAAGYNPNGMVEMMKMLEQLNSSSPIEFFSTHPSPENRLELIEQKIREKGWQPLGLVNEQDYRKNVLSYLP
jgi:predicted Zn-dependent protease